MISFAQKPCPSTVGSLRVKFGVLPFRKRWSDTEEPFILAAFMYRRVDTSGKLHEGKFIQERNPWQPARFENISPVAYSPASGDKLTAESVTAPQRISKPQW